MATAEKAVAHLELEDYLVLENANRYKHEYVAGVLYAVQGDSAQGMGGGSAVHADVIRNIGFALHQRLKGTPCSVKMTEMRLRVDAADAMFYPDVIAHCRPVLDRVVRTGALAARRRIDARGSRTQPALGCGL